jgi:endonuclease G
MPTLNQSHVGEPVTDQAGDPWVIPYYHYSLVMNRDRRLLSWAASNVDYSDEAREHTKARKEYGGENWRLDPRVALVASGLQIEDADFYAPAKKIDRGHIVRREDSAWGATAKEAEFGNSDTYHWTNCTPQSEAFNQSGKSGIWGKFEITSRLRSGRWRPDDRLSGPVLSPGPDTATATGPPWSHGFGRPVHLQEQEQAGAPGQAFDQTEPVQRLGYERMDMEAYEVFQMPIAEITSKTGVVFDASVLQADVLKGGRGEERVRGHEAHRVRSVGDVVLRGEYERGDGDLTGLVTDYTRPRTPARR